MNDTDDPIAEHSASTNRRIVQLCQRYPVTIGVIVVCSLIYLIFQAVPELAIPALLTQSGEQGTSLYLSFFTASFSHFESSHLVMNLATWLITAVPVERYRRADLLILLVIAGVSGNVAQYLVHGGNFLGLSGVVYGLVGYLCWLQYVRKKLNFGFPNGFFAFFLLYLVITPFIPLFDWLAHEVHLGGFVAGCVIGVGRELFLRLDKY